MRGEANFFHTADVVRGDGGRTPQRSPGVSKPTPTHNHHVKSNHKDRCEFNLAMVFDPEVPCCIIVFTGSAGFNSLG